MRNADGPAPDQFVSGTSVARLIANYNATLRPKFVTIALSNGSDPSALGQGDLAAPNFRDGLRPVVYVDSSNNIGYIRPQRSAADINIPDFLPATADNCVLIEVHTSGSLLTPQLRIPPTAKANAPVTFADDSNEPSGTSYRWTFGDGATSTTATSTVQHKFASSATYQVSLVVTAADGSYGKTATFVTVGKSTPPTGTNPGGGAGSATSGHNAGRSSGNGNGTVVPSSPGSGGTGNGSPRSGPAGSAPGSKPPTDSATGIAPALPGPATRSISTQPGAAAGAGAFVQGRILAGGRAVTLPEPGLSAQQPVVPQARAAARSTHNPSRLALLWLLLVPAMILAGVLGERRRPSRRASHGARQ